MTEQEKAAQCWCDPRTEHIAMIPELATVFAEKLASERKAVLEGEVVQELLRGLQGYIRKDSFSHLSSCSCMICKALAAYYAAVSDLKEDGK